MKPISRQRAVEFLRYAIPLALIGALVGWMASGPLYGRYNLQGCIKAYADARDHGDTARVDLHPYHSEWDNRGRHFCGEVRAQRADAATLIKAP